MCGVEGWELHVWDRGMERGGNCMCGVGVWRGVGTACVG